MILHVIIDNREQKLKHILDLKKDIITYDSEQLDVADIVVIIFIGNLLSEKCFKILKELIIRELGKTFLTKLKNF